MNNPVRTFFITATGTDIGKTLVSAALCHQLKSRGISVQPFKPIISGYKEQSPTGTDSGILLQSNEVKPTHQEVLRISPWRYKDPISPDMAAQKEQRPIHFEELIQYSLNLPIPTNSPPIHVNIIEGVGGPMVPIDDRHTVMDWMVRLKAEIILVTGSYLGTISHTLTTLKAMEQYHLSPIGIIISESKVSPVPLKQTAETITRFAPKIPLITIPRVSVSTKFWTKVPDLLCLLKL